jgi:hypothetical protein
MRTCKSAFAVVAGLVLVAAGCGGGSAGPGTGTSSPAPSRTALIATPTQVDPDALFDMAIAEGPAWKSFHLKIALSGSITEAAMKAMGNPSWAKLKSAVQLDGTAIEGDMDPVHLACDLTMTVPAIPALLTGPTTAEAIVLDPTLYLKVSALGPKFHKVKMGTLSGDLGVKAALPTPGGSSLVGIADGVSSLRQALEHANVTPSLVGIDQIGGKPAYHIDLAVPLGKLNADLSTAAAGASSSFLRGAKFDSASAGIWIYEDGHQLAQVQISGASSAIGNLSFTMTLTNFDQPVTIAAPPASDVAAGA